MSSDKKPSVETLLDSYLEELLSMSDKEVLGDADPAMLKAEAHRMVDAAKAIAGKRRLASAKAQVANRLKTSIAQMPTVSPLEARAYLKKAANDSRFTLAARELEEMSDEDVMMLYQQIRLLEESDDNDSEESK
jgi:hypothetical protein